MKTKQVNFRHMLPVLITLLISVSATAQQHKVVAAISAMERGSLDSARMLIDEAAVYEETNKDVETWYVKGFIYRELSKKSYGTPNAIKYGNESFEALKKASSLGPDAERTEDIKRLIKGSLIPILNNSIAQLMDATGYTNAEKAVNSITSMFKYLNPKFNVDSFEVAFYLAVGTYYQNMYVRNMRDGSVYLDYAQDAFNKVLIREQNNYSANYNMGIVFYNQGVNLIIHQLDYDSDIGTTLKSVQDKAVELFKRSLPFMLKAYSIDPNKKEPVIGLSGIYFSLNEVDKYEEFRRKSEDLEKK